MISTMVEMLPLRKPLAENLHS